MFKDEQTGNIIHANLDESVIHATPRNCDLIPAFLDVIKDTPEYEQILQHIPAYVSDDKLDDWWESVSAIYIMEDIFDTLNMYAPIGYYFGAHKGDGSDFGFWEARDDWGDEEVASSYECEHCGHWLSYFADKEVVHCVDCGRKLK